VCERFKSSYSRRYAEGRVVVRECIWELSFLLQFSVTRCYQSSNTRAQSLGVLLFSVPGGTRRCFVHDVGTRGKVG
jgi:hypothetical protein